MKTFKLTAYEEMGGYATVQAENEEQAKKKIEEHLHNHGMNTAEGVEIEVTNREVHIQY